MTSCITKLTRIPFFGWKDEESGYYIENPMMRWVRYNKIEDFPNNPVYGDEVPKFFECNFIDMAVFNLETKDAVRILLTKESANRIYYEMEQLVK